MTTPRNAPTHENFPTIAAKACLLARPSAPIGSAPRRHDRRCAAPTKPPEPPQPLPSLPSTHTAYTWKVVGAVTLHWISMASIAAQLLFMRLCQKANLGVHLSNDTCLHRIAFFARRLKLIRERFACQVDSSPPSPTLASVHACACVDHICSSLGTASFCRSCSRDNDASTHSALSYLHQHATVNHMHGH